MRLVPAVVAVLGVAALGGSPARAGDELGPNTSLAAGDRLTSKNGRFRLDMQADGNLVLYADRSWYAGGTAVWTSGTAGAANARCVMQDDGNLVVYGAKPGAGPDGGVWASDTRGHAGARLVCQDDGNLVIYRGHDPIWSSRTAEVGEAMRQISLAFTLIFGVELHAGDPMPPLPAPRRRPKAGSPPVAPLPANAGWRLGRYAKWTIRIGGRLVPFVGWAFWAADAALLTYDAGHWIYRELADHPPTAGADKGVLRVTATEAGDEGAVVPISTGPDTIALLFRSGFLGADAGTGEVRANRTTIGDGEKFRVTRHADATISLLALGTGRYLSARDGGGAGLTATADTVGGGERFVPEAVEGKLFLRTPGGRYVGVKFSP